MEDVILDWAQEIDYVDSLLTSLNVLNASELDYIRGLLDSIAVYNFDHSDAISDWINVNNKFKNGVVSGHILILAIYSSCYWENFDFGNGKIETRWGWAIRAAIGDLLGGVVATYKYIYDHPDWANDNCVYGPGCGADLGGEILSGAASSSAGPFGVLIN